jgi:predicted AlkP superfamily phosphohydrolase/phosphomutase/tetratricopeptide (TPR) repeat protein
VRALWLGAAVALLLAVAGIRPVAEGSVGILESPLRGERVFGPGIHWRLPLLERLSVHASYLRAGSLTYTTPEGATLDLSLRVALRLTAPGATSLLARGSGAHAGERIAAAIDALVVETVRRVTPADALPTLDDTTRRAVFRALAPFGEPDGEIELAYDEGSPVTAAIREAEAWREIRGRRHETGQRVLIVGLDGADWQLAEPLIARGQLPTLKRLRDRGAWGNVRALTPILSPLLWTSVATGVTPDRHGVLDFLVRDSADGRLVPVDSRFRRVRALWNVFSDAGLEVDVVAWWATWPAEPIRGHMITDRVAYSLFDYGIPAAGLGTTHPAGLFDEIRPALLGAEDVTLEELRRFVDIDAESFRESRRRLEQDRERAVREPLNHLAKVVASTRSYHSGALRLLERGPADLTAVYYQGIDEVGHRFMHFMPPRLDGIDPEDVRRYGGAVERFYVWQDELLGDLLERVGDDTNVIVVSDHGFLNAADRPRDETADIEGKPGRWHRPFGMIVLAGPAFEPGRLDTTSLLDVFPTVLCLAGLPVPDDADGRVLTEALRPSFRERFPPRSIPTYELTPFRVRGEASAAAIAAVDREIVENLRALGYVGGGGESFPERALPEATAAPEAGGALTVTAHTNLAAVLLAAGDLAGAEREILAALEQRPRLEVAQRQLFTLRARQQRHADALEVAERVLREQTQLDPRFLARVAEAYLAAGRGADGIRVFSAGVGEGRWARGSGLARLLLAAGDAVGARREAEAVLRRDPLNEDAMVTLVRIARANGTLAEVEPLLEQALGASPRSVMHLNWLAIACESRGDTERAEALLERALEANPDHGGAMANLGAFRARHGRPAEAVAVLERALKMEPGNVDARINLGTALAMLDRLEPAIFQFEQVVDAGVERTDVLNALARAHGRLGHLPEAASWLRRSLGLDPAQEQIRAALRRIEAAQSIERR